MSDGQHEDEAMIAVIMFISIFLACALDYLGEFVRGRYL